MSVADDKRKDQRKFAHEDHEKQKHVLDEQAFDSFTVLRDVPEFEIRLDAEQSEAQHVPVNNEDIATSGNLNVQSGQRFLLAHEQQWYDAIDTPAAQSLAMSSHNAWDALSEQGLEDSLGDVTSDLSTVFVDQSTDLGSDGGGLA